jgi:hypothetical protein
MTRAHSMLTYTQLDLSSLTAHSLLHKGFVQSVPRLKACVTFDAYSLERAAIRHDTFRRCGWVHAREDFPTPLFARGYHNTADRAHRPFIGIVRQYDCASQYQFWI